MADGARGRASTRSARRAEVAAVDAPVVSLRALRDGDVDALRTLRDALRVAPGWFTLDADCAIPSALVRECYDRAREFFALPPDVKKCYLHTQYERETGGCVRASGPASSSTPRGRWAIPPARAQHSARSERF
jgi:isopenicillin N synthase-like dioxygenase